MLTFRAICDNVLKGAGHKYIAKIPTGNPDRPYRYVYAYRGERPHKPGETDPDVKVIRRYEEIEEGTAFADDHEGHGGHWHVTEASGGTYTLEHDETGETKTFTSRHELVRWVHHELHGEGLEAERRRRIERSGRWARAAIGVVREHFDAWKAEPTARGLYRISQQWSIVLDRAEEARWSHRDWLDALGGETELPESFAAMREEFHDLEEEMLQAHPGTDSLPGALDRGKVVAFSDPEKVKQGARYLLLKEALKGRGSTYHAFKGKVREEGAAMPEVTTISAGSLFRQREKMRGSLMSLIRREVSERLGRDVAMRELDKVVITATRADAPVSRDDVERYRKMFRALRRQARAREGIVFAPTVEEDRETEYRFQSRQLLQEIVRHFGRQMGAQGPVPELYRDEHTIDKPSRKDIVGAFPHIQTGEAFAMFGVSAALKAKVKGNMKAALQDGADPVLSGARFKLDGAPGVVSAPLSMLWETFAHDGPTQKQTYVREQKERVGKWMPKVLDVYGKMSDLQDVHRETVRDLVQQELVRRGSRVSPAMVMREWDQRISDKDDLLRQGMHLSRLMSAGRSRGLLGQWTAEDAAFAASFKERARRRIFEAIRERVGHTSSVEAGLEKVVEVTDEEAETSLREMFPHASAPKGKKALHTAYDVDADPLELGRLLAFASEDVLSTVRIEVHDLRRSFRPHCSMTNTIRLDARSPQPCRAIWHEYGHAIEHASTDIAEAARTLRDERGKQTPRKRLKARKSNGGEVTYEDSWISPYTGKWYGADSSTEVLAMGAEHFMVDPVAFHKADPTHFAFTVAALTGQVGQADKDPQQQDITHLRELMKEQS